VEIRWGSYDVILDLPLFKVKMLNIKAGKKLSLQKHSKLSEFFFTPNGEVRVNLPGVWQAPTALEDMTIPEAQVGEADENDIERILEDSKEYEAEVCKKIDLNY